MAIIKGRKKYRRKYWDFERKKEFQFKFLFVVFTQRGILDDL